MGWRSAPAVGSEHVVRIGPAARPLDHLRSAISKYSSQGAGPGTGLPNEPHSERGIQPLLGGSGVSPLHTYTSESPAPVPERVQPPILGTNARQSPLLPMRRQYGRPFCSPARVHLSLIHEVPAPATFTFCGAKGGGGDDGAAAGGRRGPARHALQLL